MSKTDAGAETFAVQEGPERLNRGPFFALCANNALGWFGAFLVYPVLPLYVRSLGGGDVAVGVVGSAFSAASIIGRLITGVTIERWGRRRLVIGGTAAAAVIMLLYEVAPAIAALVVIRVLHALVIAIATTTSTVIVADLAPPKRRGQVLAYYAIGTNAGVAFAPSAAWLLMGVTSLPLQSFSLVFVAGAVAYGFAALCALPVPETGQGAPATPNKGSLLVASFSLDALVPALVMFAACFVYSCVLYFLPLAAADRGGNVALYFIAYAVATIASRPFIGRYADHLGPRLVALPMLLLMGVGAVLLAIEPVGPSMVAAGVLQGVGFGGAWVSMMTLVVSKVPLEARGAAIATQQVGSDAGSLAGSLASGIVAAFAGYSATFLGAAIVVALTMIGFFAYVRRNSTQQSII